MFTTPHGHNKIDDDSTVNCSELEELLVKERPVISSRKVPRRGPLLVKREPIPSRPAPGSFSVVEKREPIPLRPPPSRLPLEVRLSKLVADCSADSEEPQVEVDEEPQVVEVEEFDAEMTQMQPAKQQPSDGGRSGFFSQISLDAPSLFSAELAEGNERRENRYDHYSRFYFADVGRPWHETRQVWLGAVVAVFLIVVLAVITLAVNSAPKDQSVKVRSVSSKSLHSSLSTMEPKKPVSSVSVERLTLDNKEAPKVSVKPSTTARSVVSTGAISQTSVLLNNCDGDKAADVAPPQKGQPGLSAELDAELDIDDGGAACEK